MTRILYWNINNFSLGKIFDTSGAPQFNDSIDRLSHIVNQVMAPNIPDIFVIVEVYSRTREVGLEGTVLGSGGRAGQATLLLLDVLRNVFGSQWCLVPPLNLGQGGQREAVAVYYNSTNLQFAGPYIFWPRWVGIGQGQPPNVNTIGAIMDYPATWRNAMPNPTNPIGALQLNRQINLPIGGGVNVPEYRFAGQWEYYTVPPAVPPAIPPPYAPNRIFFPGWSERSPFHTQFVDLTAGANNRLVKLFAVHTSPATAVAAVNNMATIPETLGVAGSQVSVVLGDFNIDTFNMAQNGAYGGLDANYTMALDPRDGTGAVNIARHAYCLTHLLPTAQAWPFNNTGVPTDPQHNLYPRYGYMGSSWPVLSDTGAIDNVFTWYGGGAGAVGPAANISVVNTIMGKPYNAIPAPAGVTAELVGGLGYGQTLAIPIPPPTAMPATLGGINPPVDTIFFQAWPNYGRIHSVSDHLALAIDV